MVSNRSQSGNLENNLQKIAELTSFYDEEEHVKLLFSTEWKDREHALYLLE